MPWCWEKRKHPGRNCSGISRPGSMQALYRARELSNLQGLPVPRYDLLDLKKYKLLNIPSQTTRGCPYNCSYCEVTQVYGGKFRHRPVAEVIHEIKEIRRLTKSDFIYFVDDNFVANRRHAMAIMEQLIPLKLIYGCLATASVGDDLELLDLMTTQRLPACQYRHGNHQPRQPQGH